MPAIANVKGFVNNNKWGIIPGFGPTITVSWTETSDPTQFNPIWSDGAADAEAGDTRFDDWFGYSGVRLSEAGIETAEQKQSGGNLDITQLGTLTSGDNVMIKFPVRGIKMSKNGSTVTLSMTKELGKEGYQYYAFNRNGTIKDSLYLGAYKGARVTDGDVKKLKSWSGVSVASSNTGDGIGYISLSNTTTGARACANNNGTGYDEITWFARNYINAMYMMKYGNPNSQSVIGQGLTSGSAASTGATDSITTATGATSTANTGRVKLFGLEDRWGNVNEWLDGAFYTSATNLNVSTTNVLTNSSWSTSSAPFDSNITIGSGSYLREAVASNLGMFAKSNTESGSNSTYYCDSFSASSGYGLRAGGYYSVGATAGAFYVTYGTVSDDGYAYYGSRLMFL